MPKPPQLLITGATGLVGRTLLPILRRQRPELSIVALVRDPARLRVDGVRAVAGDIALPRLGLDDATWHELAASTTEIIHSAATVQFDLPLAESRLVNVEGTRSVLALAHAAPGLRKFAHISTAYVNGYREGVFPEAPMPPGQDFVNTYQISKYEAECLVAEAMPSLPASIYRLPAILADTPAGEVSQFGYVHHLFRLIPNNPLPILPGNPANTIDLVPADWIAAALAHLFHHAFNPGAFRHLCAGPEQAIPLSVLFECGAAVTERHLDRPITVPRLVPLDEFEDFVSACEDRRLRLAAALIGPHVRLMGIRQAYLVDQTRADLAGSGLETIPDPVACLERTVQYCLETNWGKRGTSASI